MQMEQLKDSEELLICQQMWKEMCFKKKCKIEESTREKNSKQANQQKSQ